MTDSVRILRNMVREQRETIEAQQAEIERLKAELETIRQIINNNKPPAADGYKLYEISRVLGGYSVESQQQSEPPQKSYVPMTDEDHADFYERVVKGRVPQESLKVRILRYLVTCRTPKTYVQISKGIMSLEAFLSDLLGMAKGDLIQRKPSGWIITAAGRDYLATLDAMNKPTIETTEGYLSQID